MVNWGYGDALEYECDTTREVAQDRYMCCSVGHEKFETQVKPKGKSLMAHETCV